MNITKSKLRIRNWNCQGLSLPGIIEVLADEYDNYKLDVVLIELHWPGKEKIGRTSGKSGPDSNKRENMVEFMLSPFAAKSLLSYESISDRLM